MPGLNPNIYIHVQYYLLGLYIQIKCQLSIFEILYMIISYD